MSPVSISHTDRRMAQWVVVKLTAVWSLGFGWYLGGRPEVFWSMERERLHALVEYSHMVHVGLPLAEQAQLCRLGLDDGSAAVRDGAFTVYMVGYDADSCCIDDSCGSIGELVRSWGGRVVMAQSFERARFFGVRAVVDSRGEHLADRLVVVTDASATVKGIFRSLDSRDLDAAIRYSLARPPRGPSMLALAMDRLHIWANNAPLRL